MANDSAVISDALLKEADRVTKFNGDLKDYSFSISIKSKGAGQRSLEITSQCKGQLSEEFDGSV